MTEDQSNTETWFEDESFWVDTYPFVFSNERFEIADAQIEQILKLTGFSEGTVLDLCCGPGRHSVALAKRGLRVIAVDRTRYLLDKAEAWAAEAGLDIEFVREDMRRFVRPNAFGLILNLFTSFGYFDAPDEDAQVLRNMFESLMPGGTFMIDTLGKEIFARKAQPTVSMRLEDGSALVQCHEIRDEWTRIHSEWIFIRGDKAKTVRFRHTVYSGRELKTLFLQAGFENVKVYGDFAGTEYGLNSERLVVVGRKPA